MALFASASASSQAVKVAKRSVTKATAKYATKSAAKKAASRAAAESFAALARQRALRSAPEVSSYAVKKGVRGEGERIVRHEARSVLARAAVSNAERVGGRRLASMAARDFAVAPSPAAALRRRRLSLSAKKPLANMPAAPLKRGVPASELASREVSSVCRKFSSFEAGKFKRVELPDGSVSVSYPGHSTSAKFSANGKRVMAKSGSRESSYSQNEFLNNPLPNKTYEVDEHAVYQTDGSGRTVFVRCNETALFRAGEHDMRTGRPSFKNLLERDYGVSNSKYDGGHLVSNANNGAHEKINVIPMESSWQRHGAWAKFERERQKAVKEGKSVFTQMKISYYADAPSIPQKIVVDTWIDGKKITKVFNHPQP